LRIGLFGFGRTGRLVAEELIRDPSVELSWVVRKSQESNHEYASDFLGQPHHKQGLFFSKEEVVHPDFFDRYPVDAIIDFSSVEALAEYGPAADRGIPIVSAISHYGEAETALLHRLAEKTAVLHSANITLGINFLIVASQVLQQIIPHADIEVIEEHFRDKPGASGTALKIAELLELDATSRVNSIRVGGIVGNHEIVFGLPYQTIRLKHETISRAAFGAGALYAARALQGKAAGLYTMEGLMRASVVENIAVGGILNPATA